MKIVIFLVLAGLSLATDCDKSCEKKRNCFIAASQSHENDDNFKKASIAYVETLTYVGCTLDDLLHTGQTLENLSQNTGEFLSSVYYTVSWFADSFGLYEGVASLLCTQTGDVLASKCLAELLQGDIPNLYLLLDGALCTENLDSLFEEQLMDFFIHLKCFGDDALHRYGILKQLFDIAGVNVQEILKEVIGKIKLGLAGANIARQLACGGVWKIGDSIWI
ncbi:uncharacterized protein [Engystomops pustulosus]|uniref:uncharacterized protein isoform X2 n=1 Tax=Engystomops pustulosus TaxID=76066 RepID=UPI003AFB06EE